MQCVDSVKGVFFPDISLIGDAKLESSFFYKEGCYSVNIHESHRLSL
jgi:hypothetical protein